MPNRIIKESICTSEEIERLTPFQEIMFYRLIVNCDDYGRMDARAKILKSKLFPLRDARVDQIEAALEALSSAELVILYEVDGKPFLQMKTWDRHQRVRAKVSKYPAPADACCQMTADCGHMTASGEETPQGADIGARNPIQSESKSKSESEAKRDNTPPREEESKTEREKKEDADFDKLWAAFPVKYGDIQEAFFVYLGVLQKGVSGETLIEAAQRQAAVKGRFMPGCAKWLKNQGWTEPVEAPNEEKQVGKPQQTGKSTTFMDALQNRRKEA